MKFYKFFTIGPKRSAYYNCPNISVLKKMLIHRNDMPLTVLQLRIAPQPASKKAHGQFVRKKH